MIVDRILDKLKGNIVKKIIEYDSSIKIYFINKDGSDNGWLEIKVKNKDVSYKHKEKK